jgi:hypothetical protein
MDNDESWPKIIIIQKYQLFRSKHNKGEKKLGNRCGLPFF